MSSANCPGRFRWGLTHPSVHRHAFGARSLNLGLSRALGRLDNTRTIDARGHDSRVVVHVGGALPVRVVPLFQSIVYASGSLVQLLNAVAGPLPVVGRVGKKPRYDSLAVAHPGAPRLYRDRPVGQIISGRALDTPTASPSWHARAAICDVPIGALCADPHLVVDAHLLSFPLNKPGQVLQAGTKFFEPLEARSG